MKLKLAFLAITLCLISCKTNYQSEIGLFSDASSSLADLAIRSFRLLDSVTIERKITELATSPDIRPDTSKFVGLLENTPTLNLRLKLFNALKLYSVSLGALNNADYSSEVDKASTNLLGALGTMKSDYPKLSKTDAPVSDMDLKIISTAISAIGKKVLDEKKHAAIKKCVIQADPTIVQVCSILSSELTAMQGNVSRDLKEIYQDMVADYHTTASKMSFEERRTYLRRIQIQYAYWKATDRFFNTTIIIAKEIGSAHTELRKAVEQNKFSSESLSAKITELSSFAQETGAFYNSLNQTK